MQQTLRACLLLLALAAPVAAQQYTLPDEPAAIPAAAGVGPGGDPLLKGCVVGLVNKIELPASEAGVLVYLGVKPGSEIRAEEVIAQIDDREARQQKRIAEFALESAEARADDTIERDYSQAAAAVALADWEEMMQANDQVKGAVPDPDVRRARLEWRRADLGTQRAIKDQELAVLDANVKRAEHEMAQIAIERRQVRAPFDGEVLEVIRHQQEWVQPGETIAVVAQLDTLQVDGLIAYEDYPPSEIEGCEVTINVPVGGGKVAPATGRIVYIDSMARLQDRHMYLVRAEIANRRENGRWLIHPNLSANMTIHLGTGGKLGVGARSLPGPPSQK